MASPKHVGTKLVTRHTSGVFDGQNPIGRGLALPDPLRNRLGRDAASVSEGDLATEFFNRHDERRSAFHNESYKASVDGMSSTPSLAMIKKAATLRLRVKRTLLMTDDNAEVAAAISKAIEDSGKSQAQIAREMDVTPQAVTGWVKTGRIGKATLRRLAAVIDADLVRLMGGRENTAHFSGLSGSKVPLISWVQAGHKNPVSDPFQPGAPEEWEETTVNISKGAFALRVRGDSMVAPDGSGFPPGSILIVDPNVEARNGDYVVVRFENSDEATFKRLVVDGPLKLLRPLNPTYPTIPVTEDARLAGVVVEYRMVIRFR